MQSRSRLSVRTVLAALLPLTFALACSSEDQEPDVVKVGLKPIDVRETAVDPDAVVPGADEGDGGDEGGDDGVDPDAKDSLSLFRRTTYPKLVEWCGACHATAQTPFFANPDPIKAHDELLTAQKVDLAAPELSRIVRRQLDMTDKHNCPSDAVCTERGNALLGGVTEWKENLEADDPGNTPEAPKTGLALLADAVKKTVPGTNPPGVIMLEAEAGTLKAPFAMANVATASNGKVVQTPAGAGTQDNAATAAAQATLGTAIYTLDIKEAGTYRLHGLVNGPTATTNGFWIKMDNGALAGWLFTANAANYTWDLSDNVVGVGTPNTFTLTAGAHTLEIRQRREQAKFDKLVLTNDPMYVPANAGPATREVNVLTYDIADQTGVAGAKFTIEVSDYSTNAYMFKNPTIVLPTGSLAVKNVKLLINDVFSPQNATYTIVDKTVAAPGGVLTSAALVALKDKGPDVDQFSFVFETLEAK